MAVACQLLRTITMETINFIVILFWIILKGYNAAEIKEYCNNERFRASCPSDQVVVMQTARYGRMEIGKCIDENLGHLGCSADAMNHLDSVCSGRKNCGLVVGRIDIPVVTTCPKHFVQYLEAGYSCVKVLQYQCTDQSIAINEVTVLSSEDLQRCGASGITFSATPGQRLNISAQYFNWDDTSTSHCRRHYGSIRDSISSNSAAICSSNQREKHVMISNGNSVEICLSNEMNTGNFLLKVSIQGCGDIAAPVGGWVQREGEELRMGCHSGKHTWTLTCVDNQWEGVTGQCGTDVAMPVSKPENKSRELWGLSPGILVFAVCSVLVFLSAMIFTMGVCVHVNRSKPATNKSKQVLYEEQRHILTMHPGNFDPHTGTLPMQHHR